MVIYREYPEVYDKLYDDMKDYQWEARRLKEVIPSHADTLVDFGCGTGLHDEYLVDEFDLVGVDVNDRMIDVAQGKGLGAQYVEGDLVSVSLGRRFDVAVSLFGVLSYLEDTECFEAAIQNMSDHLHDEGVLIIDFLEPRRKEIEEGPLRPHTYYEDGLSVARTGRAEVPAEDKLLMKYHTVVADETVVDVFQDVHELKHFTREEYESAFSKAGLDAELVGEEWPLWVASK
jgi:predicted TPR repeat methyltransferase